MFEGATTTLGVLGPAGSYGQEAANLAFPTAKKTLLPTIRAIFDAVLCGEINRGLIPFENLIQGPVTEALDCLWETSNRTCIADMVLLPIRHALGALEENAELRRILSKDQALDQCSIYLSEHYPQAELSPTPSTSFGMQRIRQEELRDTGAIGSESALTSYGLNVLARDIGNARNNKTRFAVVARRDDGCEVTSRADTTALMIYPHRNRIGMLQDILAVVSTRYGLNLTAIHSRPDREGAFRFYVELEGSVLDPKVHECIEMLRKSFGEEGIEIRSFGSFPRASFADPQIRTVGIIGGTGAMGQWLARFFSSTGYTVKVAGRQTDLTLEDCVRTSDAIIVNVPIEDTASVIQQAAASCRPGQLLTDNTSVKQLQVEAMCAHAPPGVEVLGMHTVFGPHVESVAGQNVVFTPTSRSEAMAEEFENVFYKHGARITRTTPLQHDRQMAFHQNLVHLCHVALADVLRAGFLRLEEVDRYCSPNSRASLATLGRMLSGNPELYAQIQQHNKEAPSLLRTYSDSIEKLVAGLESGNTQAFQKVVQEAKDALDPELVSDWKKQR